MIDVSIIIVNWNTAKLTKECVESIFEATHGINFEVFVVDNNSSDESVEVLRRFDNITLIANSANEGFAKANNIAIRKAKGRNIFLLNPDTIVQDGAIETMVKYLDDNKEVGVVGCKLLNPDRSLQESCRQLPKMAAYSLILLKLHHVMPNAKALRNYFMSDMNYEVENDVEQVMGAALMYRREVLGNNPSLLDEAYWIWLEEVDFCCNVLKKGYKIKYIPNAQIIHYKAQSFNQVLRVKQQKNFNKSIRTYFNKNGSKSDIMILNIIEPISILISYLVQIFKLFKLKK